MSINLSKKSRNDLEAVLSIEQYRAVIDEDSSLNKQYSQIGHLYPEKTPQFKWFKSSRGKEMRGDLAD